MMYKIVNGLVAVPAVDYLTPKQRSTRHNNSLAFNTCVGAPSCFYEFYFPRTVLLWNGLPDQVVTSPTLEAFKVGLSRVAQF